MWLNSFLLTIYNNSVIHYEETRGMYRNDLFTMQ